jgi:methyl-accepting chemotaxis protein
MKWYRNLSITWKLMSAFIILTMIASAIGLVGFIATNDLGNQKLNSVEYLMSISEDFTRINALENLVISPNLTIPDRIEVLSDIEAVESNMMATIEKYNDLKHDEEEKRLFDSGYNAMMTYIGKHEELVSNAESLNAYNVENASALRYVIAAREKDHFRWIWLLDEAMIQGKEFTGQLDGTLCGLGKWLNDYQSNSSEINEIISEMEGYHLAVHNSGESVNRIMTSSSETKLADAYAIYERETLPNMESVLELLSDMDDIAERSESIFVEMTDQALNVNLPLYQEASEKFTYLVDYVNDEASSAVTSSITLIIIFTVTGALISITLGFTISRIIKKPISKILVAANKIADGNLDVETGIDTKDEVGMLAKAFDKMTLNINNVMTNINAASDQVASGSRQLSDSSMSLSQGATEQASSIEELTASVEEISSQTKSNADHADKAKTVVEETYTFAQHGNNQMEEMVKAMGDINESSTNISKIIKVIDDIAFQTNILALNAAVEAARAGQHGKGFAVVAEEVRNLAARSADAAKETTTLIEGSIKRVANGTNIATSTSEALTKIVNGVSEATTLISEISVASNEQSLGVDQINLGLTQISDVVQTTSATAEETAAASEELSGQADMLKAQVANFKLRSYKTDEAYGGERVDPDVSRMLDEMNRSGTTESTIQPLRKTKQISLSDNEFDKY